MKRFNKINSKKGFTLVEVMLAVVILVMSSTMIMQGFITTMNCSRNSTIYSRVGSENYSTLISKISAFSQMSATQREHIIQKAQNGTLSFNGTSYTTGINIWAITSSGTGDINVAGAASVGANEADMGSAVIDNRYAFFYVDSDGAGHFSCDRDGKVDGKNPDGSDHIHHSMFRYCYVAGTLPAGHSDWANREYRCIAELPSHTNDNDRYCFQVPV